MNKRNPVRLEQFVPSADGVTGGIAVEGIMVATLLVLVTILGLAAAAWFYRNRMRPLVPLAQVHPKTRLPKTTCPKVSDERRASHLPISVSPAQPGAPVRPGPLPLAFCYAESAFAA